MYYYTYVNLVVIYISTLYLLKSILKKKKKPLVLVFSTKNIKVTNYLLTIINFNVDYILNFFYLTRTSL